MAHAYTSTVELLQLADGNISDIDVSELLEQTPMLARMNAIVASNSTSHEWLKKTANPAAGFRAINDGAENTKAAYSKVTQALKLFDASFAIDKGLLMASGGDALKRREAMDHLSAAFISMEKQIIYGTGEDASGFSGLVNETSVDAKADAMVVDATGTSAAATTSVWAVRSSDTGVSVVYGAGGRIEIGSEYDTTAAGSATGVFDVSRTPILFWGGVQVATTLDMGRICNLTAQAGKGLTDILLSQLLSKFESGRSPSFFAMNRQSHSQLQQSRTTYSPTGQPAPFPMEAFGIPIVVTDQIVSTEAVVA